MLVLADIEQKQTGNKVLFAGLRFHLDANEKVAIIGRNGAGKTTLLHMLIGTDKDYAGTIVTKPGIRMVATEQEHYDLHDQTALAYVVQRLPDYAKLKHILDTYPLRMGEDLRKIETYSEALERFSRLDYFSVEERAAASLERYQLHPDRAMDSLSGGQKRFVELVRIEHSTADLTLLDEPTNHMDYAAKLSFLEWFDSVKHAVVVITHDRDLLQHVSRIVEIKDRTAINFKGNYDAYLRQNMIQTANSLNEYETTKRRIENVKKQIEYARAKKAIWHGTADQKNPFVVLETRLFKELEKLNSIERPSFWIDRESAAGLRPKIAESYARHKARTIAIRRHSETERSRALLELDGVTVGYGTALFSPLSRRIVTGNRIHLIGRNGAGKTTLVKTILARAAGQTPATLLSGAIMTDIKLRINFYEQELNDQLLGITLAQAIMQIYEAYGLVITNEHMMRLLADYLFDPYEDREALVRNLSGGQKARLQLMKLFANNPNLIILDEPTNHLDLPSIEELEAALRAYQGALLYISHDSYLTRNIGGDSITLSDTSISSSR